MVIVRSSFWSSFWVAFHFPIFEVCSFCAWYDLSFFGTQLLNVFGGFISCRYCLAGWMSSNSKTCKHVYQSHRFLCNPYRSWEFHDSIKYQCPGETVPNGRRFWRALIYIHLRLTHPALSSPGSSQPPPNRKPTISSSQSQSLSTIQPQHDVPGCVGKRSWQNRRPRHWADGPGHKRTAHDVVEKWTVNVMWRYVPQ